MTKLMKEKVKAREYEQKKFPTRLGTKKRKRFIKKKGQN